MIAEALAVSFPARATHSVLLVDDDDFIAVSLRQYLTARGCDVDVATDRRMAEHRLGEEYYDLVLVDPYMTGEASRDNNAFLRQVRSLQPSAALVVISAYATPRLAVGTPAEQPIAVLTKPQSVVFLSQLVMSALKAHANHPEENQRS